jgi:CDP-glucose 4,6-dehydratase
LRNPDAVRPWQHVLEPLWGYVTLTERLWNEPVACSGAWNFGPEKTEHWRVSRFAEAVRGKWGTGEILIGEDENPAESSFLYLDSSKAFERLQWSPRLPTEEIIDWSVEWYKTWRREPQNLLDFTQKQIERYLAKVEGV